MSGPAEPYCNHDPAAVHNGVCECGGRIVEVRFSEVHWYTVRVSWAELEDANEERDIAGLAGALDAEDEIPDAVGELLTSLSIDQPGARRQVDGREIHSVAWRVASR